MTIDTSQMDNEICDLSKFDVSESDIKYRVINHFNISQYHLSIHRPFSLQNFYFN